MITHSAFPRLYVFTMVQIMVGQQPATRTWTVCYLFSTSLFMLSVERTARIFTCRPTIPYRLLCPECVLLCCHNVAGYQVLKKTRGNVTRFGHIVSRQRVFFSLRIIGKYPVIHLHIEWQRAANGGPFFALAPTGTPIPIGAFHLFVCLYFKNTGYLLITQCLKFYEVLYYLSYGNFLKSNRFYSTEKFSKRPGCFHLILQLFFNEDPDVASAPAIGMATIVGKFVSKWISQTLRYTNQELVNIIFYCAESVLTETGIKANVYKPLLCSLKLI